MTDEQMNVVNEDGQIVQVGQESASFDFFDDNALERLASEADSRVQAMNTIMAASLKMTNHHDWVSHGSGDKSRPYLCASGAEKIARMGVTVSGIRSKKEWDEDEKGRYYIYSYTGIFTIAGRSLEAIGTCTSRDKFFAVRDGKFQPLGDVDQTNIMKSAYSNMMVNGITRLLGMRSATWEDLKAAGINTDAIQKVEYKKGTQGGSSAGDKKHQKTLGEVLVALSDGDRDKAKDILEGLTEFEGDNGKVKGLRTLSACKGKRLEIALAKAKEEYSSTFGHPFGHNPVDKEEDQE